MSQTTHQANAFCATRIAAVCFAVMFATSASAQADADQTKSSVRRPDPIEILPRPTPQPMLKAPSPGNSEAGSPVRGYIYGPPPDSGSITNRLIPPSTIRR